MGEREEGNEAIKLILMTLIRRSGSPANHSIKLMTLGPFCHHLGSLPPPSLHLMSADNSNWVGKQEGQWVWDWCYREETLCPPGLNPQWLVLWMGEQWVPLWLHWQQTQIRKQGLCFYILFPQVVPHSTIHMNHHLLLSLREGQSGSPARQTQLWGQLPGNSGWWEDAWFIPHRCSRTKPTCPVLFAWVLVSILLW